MQRRYCVYIAVVAVVLIFAGLDYAFGFTTNDKAFQTPSAYKAEEQRFRSLQRQPTYVAPVPLYTNDGIFYHGRDGLLSRTPP